MSTTKIKFHRIDPLSRNTLRGLNWSLAGRLQGKKTSRNKNDRLWVNFTYILGAAFNRANSESTKIPFVFLRFQDLRW